MLSYTVQLAHSISNSVHLCKPCCCRQDLAHLHEAAIGLALYTKGSAQVAGSNLISYCPAQAVPVHAECGD